MEQEMKEFELYGRDPPGAVKEEKKLLK